MRWTDFLNESMADIYRTADALMALVRDADLDWKPATGGNWMTTGQLLMHMTNACGFCCRGFATGDWGMPACDGDAPPEPMLPPAEALPAVASVSDARKALAADRDLALKMVAEAGEEALDGRLVAAPWEAGRERRLGEQFHGMTLHLLSHKSQLFYYLKLMGRDVNTFHLWGM